MFYELKKYFCLVLFLNLLLINLYVLGGWKNWNNYNIFLMIELYVLDLFNKGDDNKSKK